MTSPAVKQENRVFKDVLDINDITRLIPHRFPMLLVDRVKDIVPGESGTGIKSVTMNEWFFQGHFPDLPVMPGVLIVEAMAQTAAVVAVYSITEENTGEVAYFTNIDECRFRKPVLPGDQLEMKVEKVKCRGPIWRFSAKAFVNGELATEAVITSMLDSTKAKK